MISTVLYVLACLRVSVSSTVVDLRSIQQTVDGHTQTTRSAESKTTISGIIVDTLLVV